MLPHVFSTVAFQEPCRVFGDTPESSWASTDFRKAISFPRLSLQTVNEKVFHSLRYTGSVWLLGWLICFLWSALQLPIMATPSSEATLKKDTTLLEHVEDPKDRINVDFQQNVNAK